ncbi:transcriptional coactivator p15/PC4 family protein [Paraburkholderia sp. USG1]|uniref:transcriptional coactivator p15/PC4 family protein n=1 Tax=Paraburkholderia sp. USG1 TaxID=2952268 RepID=UPI002859E67F|nr:transcriptional coactivator p15/PC4 family protein [Paraburkholderia sp. USG1]MDR8396979.1 transcriptional coactivator p15/PC4 family protein [Paraburkholderia sp. USG1]
MANHPVNSRDEDITVLSIQKTARQRIVIGHKMFRGVAYVDVRLWVVDASGEYVRTQRGISIRHEQLAQVSQGILLAMRQIGQGGHHD